MFAKKLPARSSEELAAMRRAGLLVGRTLEMLEGMLAEGLRTIDLDTAAREFILDGGGRPSFSEVPGYRHTLCVSVNEEIVHGIPGERVLRTGDLVSIDCGAIVDGWHGDSARSFIVGGSTAGSGADLALIAVTRDSLWAGIAAFRPGGYVRDIGGAVEDCITERSEVDFGDGEREYGIVEEYTGHGIGQEMHLPPSVYNYRTREKGPRIVAGATLAIEPMVTLGSPETRELSDGWTVVTADGSRAAHEEHTVAVTDRGVCVTTALDGGAARLAELGVTHDPLT